MKKLIKIAKNFSLNLLWILMFICLWDVENFYLLRITASFTAALLLAIFTVLFEEEGKPNVRN